MSDRILLIYANQPVMRIDNCHYTKMRSFLDFLIELSSLSDAYRLIVPCKVVSKLPENMTHIVLPEDSIEVQYYERHWQALCASFLNAILIRSTIKGVISKKQSVTIAGPGPNSFLFWCSFMFPRSTRYVFFIRGDTLKTIQHILKGRFFSPLITGLVRLFQWRISYLMRCSRAKVFAFGQHLQKLYPEIDSAMYTISPLINESFLRIDQRPEILEKRPLNVLYVGRLSEEKNITALIEACMLASEQKRPFYLSIVGFGPLESQIVSLIKYYHLNTYVNFIGYIPYGEPLMKELDNHDLLCLCSFTEGIPGSVIEAFARGMPVLATPVGSLPELFPHEIKFAKGTTPEDIWHGIQWCDTHRAELTAMGRKGRDTIHRFLISKNAQWVHEIIQVHSNENFYNGKVSSINA